METRQDAISRAGLLFALSLLAPPLCGGVMRATYSRVISKAESASSERIKPLRFAKWERQSDVNRFGSGEVSAVAFWRFVLAATG